MPDIFDTAAEAPAPAGGDVFDRVAPDVFDQADGPKISPEFDFHLQQEKQQLDFNRQQHESFEDYVAANPNDTQLAVKKLLPLAQTPEQQAQLGRFITDRMTPDREAPGTGGQIWETLWSAPKPTTEYVQTMQGIRDSEMDGTLKLREMAKAHGLDPDKISPMPSLASRLGEGSFDAVEDLALTFQSPAGVATLGIGGLPRAAQRFVSLAFAGQMLSQAPGQAEQLLAEVRKPADERDYRKIAKLAVGGAANVGLGSLALGHALSAGGGVAATADPGAPEVKAEAPVEAAAPTAIVAPDVRTGGDVFDQAEGPAAIRVPDQAPPPQVPEGWDIHSTPHGIYLYDTERISPEEIDQTLPPLPAANPPATSPPAESATPEPPAPAVAPPLTPAVEPARVVPAAPETITGGTASDGTRGQTGPVLGNPGIPAEGEKPRSAAPSSSRPPSRADQARPSDIIDHIEGNYGKIDPALIKEANPDWKPIGAARKVFAKGGRPADTIATAAHRDGVYKGDPGQVDQLGEAINAAAQARKGWRQQFYKEERSVAVESRQESAFQREASKPGKNKEQVVSDELNVGDEFELQGAKVTVKQLHFDDNGDVSHVELEDGRKFGTRQVPAGTVLHVDKGTVQKTEPSTEFAPADPVENFLTKAIKATEHDSSQLMEGVTGAPVWMTKAAVNLTLKAALHTYRATKDLAAAVAAGLKWLKAQNLSGFDEKQAGEWLAQNLRGSPVQQDLGKTLGAAANDRKPVDASRPDEWSTTKGTTIEPFLSDLHSAFTEEGFRQRATVFKAWLGGLAGESFPRTTRVAREVGEQMARWVSSRMAAVPLADGLVDDVVRGLDLDDVEFGAMLHEDNLRSIKKGLEDRAVQVQAAGDLDKAFELRRQAEKVFTFIGKDGVWKDEVGYQEYLRNPRVQEAVKRYVDLRNRLIEPMYREAMKIEPDLQLEPRGLQTGARINLNWVRPGDVSGPDVFVSNPTPRGVLANVLTKRSPFGRIARGTAAAYRPSFRDSIRNTYARQLEIANRNKFDRMLEQSGNAITGKPGERHRIHGELAVPFEQRRMMVIRNTDGNIVRMPMSQNLYVRQSIAGEYRRALNVDESWGDKIVVVGRFNKILNGMAISGLTDVTAHVSNLATMLFTRPGVTNNFWTEVGTSALGRSDIVISLAKAFRKFSASDRVRLRELAEIGALREEHPTSGPAWNPAKVGATLIQKMDTRTRLQADHMFSNLVDQGLVKNTETNRREFVNQVGQYNKRAQGPMIRWFRDTGFGPFITAGRAFNVLGMRTALLKPGAEASSAPARLVLASTMASKIVGTMFLIGVLNYLFTRNKGGGAMGRPGTRLGTVDLGINNKAGRPLTLDVANLLGLGRAARVTGVRGTLEAVRNNLPIGVAMDSAARDIINSGISPFSGPAVRFGAIALTGQQPAVKVPPIAPIVPPGKSQTLQNIRTAAVETSPIIAGIHDSLQPGATGWEWLQKQLGRFTLQPGKPPDLMKNYAQIVDRAQASQYMDDVIRRARPMAPGERMPFIREAISHLDPADQVHAWQTVKYKRILAQ